jgi:hypothetical protein
MRAVLFFCMVTPSNYNFISAAQYVTVIQSYFSYFFFYSVYLKSSFFFNHEACFVYLFVSVFFFLYSFLCFFVPK